MSRDGKADRVAALACAGLSNSNHVQTWGEIRFLECIRSIDDVERKMLLLMLESVLAGVPVRYAVQIYQSRGKSIRPVTASPKSTVRPVKWLAAANAEAQPARDL
jgi:hypothetical protein